MSQADKIRLHGREMYVLPARERGETRFSIRAGDVVHALGMNGRTPAVCSALRTHQFLKDNHLRLVETTGPKSGQSTTVTFTYEFVDGQQSSSEGADAWSRLRGALKDIFSEAGGGEAYLRSERREFHSQWESK
jgi:hypothetical protein